jgi:farnesol dehydrogenase
MLEVNVEGTRRVAAAAIEEGVDRLVHVSSNSAIEYRGTGVRDETDIVPRMCNLTAYARSKLGAERAIESAGENGLGWIIVYPTRVFGTGSLGDSNAATRVLAARLQGRLPLLPGGGKEMANWVFADDVAEGVVRALFHGKLGERYILGGENASLREFFAIAEEIAGVSPLTIPLPHCLARAIASVEHCRSRVMRDRPRLTREWYNAIVEDTRLTVRKAQVEIGYRPTPLRDALPIVVAWLRQLKPLNGGEC